MVAAARTTSAPLATVSRSAAALWARAGVPGVGVLRNGVPAGRPASSAVEASILVAGRIAPEKGTHVAVRVARRAGLGVRIVGDVYDTDYHVTCVAPMLRPGEWLGPLPRDELSAIMARSLALVMPVGWDEAFGLVAAEAQMAGCPVVGYRRGALPEVVEHGVGGWLAEPDDEAGLAVGLERVAGLDRARIRARARRRFGLPRMVASYETALVGLVQSSAGAGPPPSIGRSRPRTELSPARGRPCSR